MRIAFFDSGLGGITVLKKAVTQLPIEDFIYYADTLHVPYGTKSKDEVKTYIIDSVARIVQEDVKALVIACNTATSIAINTLRELYTIPIVGMEPAVKPAVEMNRDVGRRVLVMATPLTLQQSKYNELVNRVDDRSIVDSLPLPELVRYCEGLNFDEEFLTDYFQNKLVHYNLEDYGTIVLGCTHYPFYRSILAKLLPDHITIIDGSNGTVKRLQEQLINRGLLSISGTGDVKFLCSSMDPSYVVKMQTAYKLYEKDS